MLCRRKSGKSEEEQREGRASIGVAKIKSRENGNLQ